MSLVKFGNNDVFPSFSSLFDNLIGRDMYDLTNRSFGGSLPAVNIKENAENFEVEVAVPGMKKEDFNITLENNLLTISSEKENKVEEKDKEGKYTRQEFSYSSFRRTFTMPHSVESDKIQAKYNEGILSIVIPKKEEAKQKPARVIQIG